MKIPNLTINVSFQKQSFGEINKFIEKYAVWIIIAVLGAIAEVTFFLFYNNGLGLAYNDARSHLDIGRRVVEGLKPGLAQLGSVWLPLPHILMIPTIWSDFMWHSGLSGALQSMVSFVGIGALIYLYLKKLGVGMLGRLFGVAVFATNLNILYLQSTAMTELLLLATMTAGAYYLMLWAKEENVLNLIKSAFFIMLSTGVRYDGWFLFLFATALIAFSVFRKRGYQTTEGVVILFVTLGGFGIALWFLWNLLIFNDPLFFVFGPYSARAQQTQLEAAGNLPTKGDLLFSLKIYLLAFVYNSYAFTAILGLFGALAFWINTKIKPEVRIASLALLAPLMFNVAALFLGHSVLFIQGISGNTWFNVRYGMMLLPSVAIFAGFLVDRLKSLRWVLVGSFAFTLFFAFANRDAVTIDDARVGSSQKNVTEVSSWLAENAADKQGLVLISAASHDAIIFSSGLPMKRFIHEGTGRYWEEATGYPDRWARWIILRTHDENDLTFKLIKDTAGFKRYDLVDHYPFADVYQLKPEYLPNLITQLSTPSQLLTPLSSPLLPTPTLPSEAPDNQGNQTANWQIYTNQEYLLSIAYPPTAQKVPEGLFKIHLQGDQLYQGTYIAIEVLPSPNRLSLTQIGNHRFATDAPQPYDLDWESTNFAGLPAFTTTRLPPGDSGLQTIFLLRHHSHNLAIWKEPIDKPGSTYFNDLADQILSTFKFLDHTPNGTQISSPDGI